MKCKQLALRVLSTAAILSIVTSCAAPAFAGTYNLAYGDISVSSKKDSTTNANNTMVKYRESKNGDEQTKEDNEEIKIVSKDDDGNDVSTSNKVSIDVEKGSSADVKLEDVTIEKNKDKTANDALDKEDAITITNNGNAEITLSNTTVKTISKDLAEANGAHETGAAMKVKGSGETTIKLEGENELTSGDRRAGLEKNDSDAQNGTLTITTDVQSTEDGTNQQPSLTAKGGLLSAGIGGNQYGSTSNITITGNVSINATGDRKATENSEFGTGAGIGGGYRGDANKISIKKDSTGAPTVVAKGSTGIGGGTYGIFDRGSTGTAKEIEIDGADITAVGNRGSAIGSGYGANGTGKITIKNSTIDAKCTNSGGYNGASKGIGGSYGDTTIDIEDSVIKDGTSGIGTIGGNLTLTIGGKSFLGKLTKWIGSSAPSNKKTNITIKDQAKIASTPGIGDDYASKVTIKIQDNAAIETVGETTDQNSQHPAIGSRDGTADITIGGSSTDAPQEGTVTIGDAYSDYSTVIGGKNGTVDIKGNVDATISKRDAYGAFTWLKDTNGNELDTVSRIKNGVLSAISKITYRTSDGATNINEKIVHGSAVCHADDASSHWKEVERVEPTCTTEGHVKYACTTDANACVSGDDEMGYKTVSLAKVPHDYEVVEDVAPTCTTAGHKTYQCKKCDDSYTENMDALNHDITDWAVVRLATCENDGEEERHCVRGDVNETRTIPAEGHSWSEWDNNGDGTETRTCTKCGAAENRTLENHEPDHAAGDHDTPTHDPAAPDLPTVDVQSEDDSTPWLYVTDLSGLRVLFDETESNNVYMATTDREDAVLTGSFDALDELEEDGIDTITFVTNQHTSTLSLQTLRACNGGRFELTHIGDTAVLTVDDKLVEGLLH